MKQGIRQLFAILFVLLARGAIAQVAFTGSYSQDFDSMGTAGTAPPAGWSFFGALGGANGTWTNATGIPASGVGGGALNNTLIAATAFTDKSNTAGYNFALPASTGDRAIGTSPTSGQGVVWQLALTNSTGSLINAIRIRYDIRRFTAAVNQLPGYWLFYSMNGGTTWQNVGALNPTLTGPAGVIVPSSAGVTTVPATPVSLASPWTAGAQLLLRWVDDNAAETSPDQILGLDNVVIDLPIGQPPTVAITSPGDGSAFSIGSTIDFTVSASDTDGSIAKVEFFEGATKLGEDATEPYGFAWTVAAAGTYGITARATDNSGNTTPSVPITVTVSAGASGTLTRGPYLQKAASDRMTIRWRSSQAVVGRVRYGTGAGNLAFIMDETSATTEHVIELTGLAARTTYYYSVGSVSDTLASGADYVFTTPPVAGAAVSTRIWVLGDAGTANASQTAVRDAFYAWTGSRTPNLVLQLGDNAYTNGTDAEFQGAVFDIYGTMLRKTPFWSCLGNHETAQATAFVNTYPYFDIYTFPMEAECGGLRSGTEHYYSFDYGNIHFVSLDSMTASRSPTGAMAMWLRSDLESATATWIVCFFHHPPYTKGSHDSDSLTDSGGAMVEMRENILPILEAGGVDLVLSGHSHCYERSYLLDGHYGDSTTLSGAMKKNSGDGRPGGNGAYVKPLTGTRDHFGAVYSVAGSAGQTGGGTLNHPAHFISLNNLGSLVLDVNGTTLSGTFVRETGATPDTFTIIKQGAADSDGDGVADAFEIANGMNRFDPSDAALDTDHDGYTALQEYLFGLNPAVPDYYGWTTSRNPTTGHIEVRFPTLPQRTYQVFWSGDLLTWNPASTEVNGDGSTMLWIDDGTVTGGVPSPTGRTFYRLRVKNGP